MWWWMLQTALVAGLLAGVAALVCRVLRPAPAICHALWLLVLVKLVTPSIPMWTLPWSPPLSRLESYVELLDGFNKGEERGEAQIAGNREVSRRATSERRGESAEGPQLDVQAIAPEQVVIVETASVPPGNREARSHDSVASNPPINAPQPVIDFVTLGTTLMGFWLAGAALFACFYAWGAFRLWRQLRRSRQASESLLDEVHAAARSLGVATPRVVVERATASPMVVGMGRAVLIWPAELSRRLDAAGCRAVLLHELAHLKRRDHSTAWLEIVATCVWWFNPLVWYVRHQLREQAELACDAWVVAQSPCARRAYATALIEVCELVSTSKPLAAPALGMARRDRQSFERRLAMILRSPVSSRVPAAALLAIGLLGLVLLPSFSTGQEPASVGAPQAENAAQAENVANPSVSNADPELKPTAPREPSSAGSAALSADPAPRIEARRSRAMISARAVRAGAAPATAARKNGSNVQTLLRVTYDLPSTQAEALATFLREHSKSEIDTKVKDNSLVVTADPTAQQTIGRLIALMTGEPVEEAQMYTPAIYAAPGSGVSFHAGPAVAPHAVVAPAPVPAAGAPAALPSARPVPPTPSLQPSAPVAPPTPAAPDTAPGPATTPTRP